MYMLLDWIFVICAIAEHSNSAKARVARLQEGWEIRLFIFCEELCYTYLNSSYRENYIFIILCDVNNTK